MNQADILKLVKESGFKECHVYSIIFDNGLVNGRLEKLIELVAQHERERCLNCYSPDDTANDWADKIREGK